MAGRNDERETLRAGGRLADALCALAGGRLRAVPGEACGGFYHPGLWLTRAIDGRQLAFLNMSVGGGSLHVFRRVNESSAGGGDQIVELDWTGPRAGTDWPERTLAQAAGALGLEPRPRLPPFPQ